MVKFADGGNKKKLQQQHQSLPWLAGHEHDVRVSPPVSQFPPFRLAASVFVVLVVRRRAVHWKFSMCTAPRTSSYSPVGPNVFLRI